MDWKKQLDELRTEIDIIDKTLMDCFQRRMDIAGKVAKIKGENNLPIFDSSREQIVADRASSMVEPRFKGEAVLLMRSLMALSREYQHSLLFNRDTHLLPPPRQPQTEGGVCAYQGIPGAWGEQAARELFPQASHINTDYFEDVFLAVKSGKARYGVVPIENSQTGAIGETYDLLRRYGCYIVARRWFEINQCLLAPAGTDIADIREVYSHPEGLKQCGKFLRSKGWDQVASRNTAVAAKLVAEKSDGISAAIGSRLAGEINGLHILAEDIMDNAANKTSFVAIAAEPEYNDKCNHIAFTFSTRHHSGALCETLMPLMAQGLNLTGVESRPAQEGHFRFFAEIEGNILCNETAVALRQAAGTCEYFEIIGHYQLDQRDAGPNALRG